MDFSEYVHDVPTQQLLNPATMKFDVIETAPAVWTLAHRGRSGMARLDIWVYPDEVSASRAGAKLAVDIFPNEPELARLFKLGRFREAMAWYESHESDYILLRVQSALFNDEDAQPVLGGD